MKKRKTKNYIVIGTSHLGMDLSVLQTIKTSADFYNAEVIHVGPLATRAEIDMWRRREKKLRTWEKAAEQKVKSAAAKFEMKQSILDDKLENLDTDDEKAYNKIVKLEQQSKKMERDENLLWERLSNDRERLEGESEELAQIQWDRISTMMNVFGDKIRFVCNDELHIPIVPYAVSDEYELEEIYKEDGDEDNFLEVRVHNSLYDILGDSYVDKHLLLGKHLFITAVPANGDKVSGNPITPRTFKMLKEMGHSHIVPHMTPHVKPFPRPGLNQAYNFWTTGAIQVCEQPKKVTDAYLSSARTSCVLVSVDTKNGEFHAQRLRVKLFRNEKSHRQEPHIIHDGVVFDSYGSVIELKSEDKGVHSTDVHAPHHHCGVVGAIRAVNDLHRPSVYIDGGDTIDNSACSPHTKGKPGEREGLRIIDDIVSLVNILDDMANKKDFPYIKNRVLLDSNHGEWLTRFVEEHPELKGLIDWPSIAKKIPEWNVFIRSGGEDKFFKFGDLVIKHADKERTISSAYSIYGNYLGGHHHSFQELGDAVFAGPACSLGPKYLQNSATSWQNQFTTMSKFKGKTCKHPKTVFHTEEKKLSRFAYRGQIFEVKHYERKK